MLLVEDDPPIREVTTLALEAAGFRVTAARDGREALAQYRSGHYDVVVLDVMLPALDGYEVCRRIRRESAAVPIVMLSAKSDTVDVVVGLELGADDYVTKPFESAELVARLRAVLRRMQTPGEPVIVAGELEIDAGAYRVRRAGEEIQLTATEFRLLLELARRPGQVFTRELLLQLVWNYDYLGDSRLVDVAVQRLRSKVEADPKQPRHIHTVRGVGYRFEHG